MSNKVINPESEAAVKQNRQQQMPVTDPVAALFEAGKIVQHLQSLIAERDRQIQELQKQLLNAKGENKDG